MNQFFHSQEPSWVCAPLLLRAKFRETDLGQDGTIVSCASLLIIFCENVGPIGFPQHLVLQV